MTGSAEWGPWIEHDGLGPCQEPVGTYIQVVGSRGSLDEGFVTKYSHRPRGTMWIKMDCAPFGVEHIARYRIRKPKGLTICEGILSEVEKQDHMQPA